ncbi:MAG: LacI family DNA-binding transcriptional regulator [Oscillospiraceae bacterium]
MTIKDLAKLSGYSLGTVSRVLNNQPNVSEQARKTILALVEEHGFERNASAQLLKQQRTKSVLIIVKGTSNEMFAAMVEKLQSLFADTDHPVIADFIDEDENEVKRAVQLCRERKPSGVLFLGGNNENFRADFDKVLVPSVVVTNDAHELRFPNLSSVSTDDCAGASCAVEYLLRSGHRNIAVLGGDRAISDTSAKRYAGCVEAFRKNGLTFDDETMYYTGRYSYEFGYNGMRQALEKTKGLTAAFAMADVIAIGAIRALFDEGLRVPEDISVVGYDGLRIGDFYVPKLTTISQSVELLAKCSFELLISCMQGAPAQHMTVPFRLLRRQSVRQITE